MSSTDTRDVTATIEQIRQLEEVGCEVIRVAVPDMEAADALPKIKSQMTVPLIADIHFDHRLALKAAEVVDCVRINPGNIGAMVESQRGDQGRQRLRHSPSCRCQRRIAGAPVAGKIWIPHAGSPVRIRAECRACPGRRWLHQYESVAQGLRRAHGR